MTAKDGTFGSSGIDAIAARVVLGDGNPALRGACT